MKASSWEPDVSAARIGDRTLFGSLEAFAYLNHAAIAPPSSEIERGASAFIASYASRGVSAIGEWLEQRERLRARLARLVGATPEEIGLVPSTTRGVIDIALCIDWKPGDRIVCLRGEFPTNVTPWQRAAATFGLELSFIDADAFRTDEGMELLQRELERGVRLLAVSAVQFQTGLRMPVREMSEAAHAAGAEVFVDAIQACGVVPVDVGALGVDYLACGAHKWLMGLQGAGFVFVASGRELVPRVAGWLSHEEPLGFLFEGAGHLRYDRPLKGAPGFLESGSVNGLGFVALEASLAAIQHVGVEAIFAHVQRYHDALEPGLLERGFESERHPTLRSGSLSACPPEGVDLPDLWRAMNERGVACTIPDGRMRFSPQWPNALDEIPGVLAALDECLG